MLRAAILLPTLAFLLVTLLDLWLVIVPAFLVLAFVSLFVKSVRGLIRGAIRLPFRVSTMIADSVIRIASFRNWVLLKVHRKFEEDCERFDPPELTDHNIELGYTRRARILGKGYRKVGIYDAELLRGLALLGGSEGQARYISELIVSEAARLGIDYVVLDADDRYRNLVLGCDDAKVLRLGVNLFVNPFEREGVDGKRYAAAIADILCSTYELSLPQRDLLFDALSTCYEERRGERVAPSDAAKVIKGAISDTKASMPAIQELDRLVDRLLQGKPAEALREAPKPPIDEIFEGGVTVIELGDYDQQFKNFARLLLLAKYLFHLERREMRSESVVLIDGAHRLLPDVKELSRSVRVSRRRAYGIVHRLKEHGMGIHICAPFPAEVDPTILGIADTLLVYRTTDYYSLRALGGRLGLNDRQVKVLTRLSPYEGILLRSLPSYEAICPILHARLPSWIFSPPPSDEELGLFRRLKVMEIPKVVRKTALEEDFEDKAENARLVLLNLVECRRPTLEALVSYMTELPDDVVRKVTRRLEGLGYVGAEDVGVRRELFLTDRGKLALEEWGERRLVKLDEFEIERVTDEQIVRLSSEHKSFKNLVKAEQAFGSDDFKRAALLAYEAAREAMKEIFVRTTKESTKGLIYDRLVRRLSALQIRPAGAHELFRLRNLREDVTYHGKEPSEEEAGKALRVAKIAACRAHWSEVTESGR